MIATIYRLLGAVYSAILEKVICKRRFAPPRRKSSPCFSYVPLLPRRFATQTQFRPTQQTPSSRYLLHHSQAGNLLRPFFKLDVKTELSPQIPFFFQPELNKTLFVSGIHSTIPKKVFSRRFATKTQGNTPVGGPISLRKLMETESKPTAREVFNPTYDELVEAYARMNKK
jgi:hypothetical protein